ASGQESGVGPSEPVILYVGRLAVEKNVEVLLAAMARVLDRTSARVVILGDGPLRPRIEAWTADMVKDRVRIAGDASDVWAWMKRASVMVSLALFEGSPNTVLEAMACACPLVVSDIPAHRELLGDDSAFFVDPRSPEAAADAIELTLKRDETVERR